MKDKILFYYGQMKDYLKNSDLIVFIIISIIIIYFLTYLISFFFQLPFVLMLAVLIGYIVYKNKKIKLI